MKEFDSVKDALRFIYTHLSDYPYSELGLLREREEDGVCYVDDLSNMSDGIEELLDSEDSEYVGNYYNIWSFKSDKDGKVSRKKLNIYPEYSVRFTFYE